MPEPRDDAGAALLEQAHDRLPRRHLQLAHDVGQLALHRRQVDARRPAEAGGHRCFRFLDDPRPLRRVGEALQHRLAAAVLRPARDGERDQPGLPGQVRIDVGGGVDAAFGRLAHLRQDGVGAALLVALHLHVRDHRDEPGARAHGDRLGHAGQRAEARFRRQPVVVGEGGAPGAGHPDHLDDVLGRGEVRRLVVEPGRHAPRAGGQTGGDQPRIRAVSSGVGRRSARPTTSDHALLNPMLAPRFTARPRAAAPASCASRSSGPLPSALTISVVTPWVSMLSAVIRPSGVAWLWMLMKPGAT